MYYNNILETIGNTPLVKLNKVVADLPALVLGKIETFNPGHSIKDRMALKMVEVAEANGWLKPGGTIIECTSGNTGMGLALAATVKGYKCIFTTNDKQSKEKMDILRALGAEVVVCPTNVTPDDPRSYYSVAEKLNKEIPNSYWFNQYDNPANAQAHFESTGPEIWEQTEGKITHLVVGVGTGGTISGTAKYLKSQNPNIKIWGIDTYGSVFKKYHETGVFDEKEIYPYITEGIGEDILPKNVDFSLIDHFEKVSDKDGALMARKIAAQEGLLLGYSAGSAVAGLRQMKDQLGPDDVVVVIFHDHGSRYVGKIYNDDWMRQRGFLNDDMTIADLLVQQSSDDLYFAKPSDTIRTVLEKIKQNDISQLPVIENNKCVGSVTESMILEAMLNDDHEGELTQVSDIMGEAFPEVPGETSVNHLNRYINRQNPAIMVRTSDDKLRIITKYDVLQVL